MRIIALVTGAFLAWCANAATVDIYTDDHDGLRYSGQMQHGMPGYSVVIGGPNSPYSSSFFVGNNWGNDGLVNNETDGEYSYQTVVSFRYDSEDVPLGLPITDVKLGMNVQDCQFPAGTHLWIYALKRNRGTGDLFMPCWGYLQRTTFVPWTNWDEGFGDDIFKAHTSPVDVVDGKGVITSTHSSGVTTDFTYYEIDVDSVFSGLIPSEGRGDPVDVSFLIMSPDNDTLVYVSNSTQDRDDPVYLRISYGGNTVPTATHTNTPPAGKTPTFTPTMPTPTATLTPTVTATPTNTGATPTPTPTFTGVTSTPTYTITPTRTLTNTGTPTFSNTATVTRTNTPGATQTFTQTYTLTPTFTATKSPTPSKTPTTGTTPTWTATWTLTLTMTPTPTYTRQPTPTGSLPAVALLSDSGYVESGDSGYIDELVVGSLKAGNITADKSSIASSDVYLDNGVSVTSNGVTAGIEGRWTPNGYFYVDGDTYISDRGYISLQRDANPPYNGNYWDADSGTLSVYNDDQEGTIHLGYGTGGFTLAGDYTSLGTLGFGTDDYIGLDATIPGVEFYKTNTSFRATSPELYFGAEQGGTGKGEAYFSWNTSDNTFHLGTYTYPTPGAVDAVIVSGTNQSMIVAGDLTVMGSLYGVEPVSIINASQVTAGTFGAGNYTFPGNVSLPNASTLTAEKLKAVDASGLDFLNDDGLPILSLGDNRRIRTTTGSLTVMNTGVSVEGAGTNVMPYAESLPTSGWTIVNNTASPATFTYQTVDGVPELYVTDVVYEGITPYIRTTATGSASSYYAFSLEARCDTGSAYLATAVRISGTYKFSSWYLTNEWKRYTWTISDSGAANSYVIFYFNNSVSGGDGYHLRRIQLEPVAPATSPSTGFIPGGMTRNAGDVVLGHDLTLLTGGANLQDATVEGTLTLGDSGQQVSIDTTANKVWVGSALVPNVVSIDTDDGNITTVGGLTVSGELNPGTSFSNTGEVVYYDGTNLNGLGDVGSAGEVLLSQGPGLPPVWGTASGAHNPITLGGSYDYLSLSSQVLTLGQIDLTTDVTGLLPTTNMATGVALESEVPGLITGGASTIASTNLTVSRALASDGSGKVSASAVTSTELGYLSGVSSAVQTQLNAKAGNSYTTGKALQSNASTGAVEASAVTSTELGYLNGVTSAIQTQIDGKQPTITGSATTIDTETLPGSRAVITNSSGKIAASAVTSTELGYLDGVTSAIQTQIDNKGAIITGSATTIDTETLTGNMAVQTDADGKIAASSTVDSTELGYLDGVTSAVQTQLNSKQGTITGSATTIDTETLTGSRAVMTNSGGGIAVSAVTATELGYLDGVTSAIQTQIDGKQPTITGSATTIDTETLTASRVLQTNVSGKVEANASVTSTELGYLDGVTSAIQTQINAKQATITGSATTIDTETLTGNMAVQTDADGKIAVSSTVDSTELGYLNGVTSAIQTQLNSKQPTITGSATTIDTETLTASRVLQTNVSGKVEANASVTSTELGYLDGVTSSIQDQLNTKIGALTGSGSTIDTETLTGNHAVVTDGSGKIAVSAVTSTELGYLDGVTSSIQSQIDGKASTTHTQSAGTITAGSFGGGNYTFPGTLAVTGDTDLSGNADIDGNTTMGGRVNFGGSSLLTVGYTTYDITITKSFHTLTGAASPAVNTLTTIFGGKPGDVLYVNGTPSVSITVIDGAGNIQCGSNFVIDGPNDMACLFNNGAYWCLQYKSLDN